jgi:drug/metabolite transporter (DMT)-like permease
VDGNDLWLLSVAAVWGGNKLAAKVLLQALSPVAVFTLQMIGVALLLGLFVVLGRRQRLCEWGPMVGAVLLSGLLFCGQRLLFFTGQRLTTVAQGALCMDTSPLWTALLVTLLGLEAMRAANWLGVALGFAGVSLVLFGGSRAATAYAPAPLLGNAVLLGSAALLAVHMVVTRGWMQRYGALRVMAMTHVVAALVILPWGVGELRRIAWPALSALDWWLLAYTIVLAGAYGFVAWYAVIRRAGAARAAMYQFLMPVMSAVAAWGLLSEQLSGWQVLGFGVTLFSVYLARPGSRPAPSHEDGVLSPAPGEPHPLPPPCARSAQAGEGE